jgi:hypothetical protein
MLEILRKPGALLQNPRTSDSVGIGCPSAEGRSGEDERADFGPSDFRSWCISRRAAGVAEMAAYDPEDRLL